MDLKNHRTSSFVLEIKKIKFREIKWAYNEIHHHTPNLESENSVPAHVGNLSSLLCSLRDPGYVPTDRS